MDLAGHRAASYPDTKTGPKNIPNIRMLKMSFFNQIGGLGWTIKFAAKIKTGKSRFFKDIRPFGCFQRYTVGPGKTSGDEANVMVSAAG